MTDHAVTWLTQEAHDRLAAELAERTGPTRVEITKRIELAREEGDLKENGGYHAAREEQGKNEARVRQLKQLLEHARIGVPDSEVDEVAPGKVVTIVFTSGGDEETFLLGSREESAHASIDVYSPTSPLGASLVGKRVGDSASYTLANGKEITVEIRKVQAYIH
ncbi:MAG: transcription elongation factor GreA [Actinomycetota bacterium]|nr:transcription elongation factor GreA [Actinomycetota bacterium]